MLVCCPSCFWTFSPSLRSMACQHLWRRSAASWVSINLPFVPTHRAMAGFKIINTWCLTLYRLFVTTAQRSDIFHALVLHQLQAPRLHNVPSWLSPGQQDRTRLTGSAFGLTLSTHIHINLLIQACDSTYVKLLQFWSHFILFPMAWRTLALVSQRAMSSRFYTSMSLDLWGSDRCFRNLQIPSTRDTPNIRTSLGWPEARADFTFTTPKPLDLGAEAKMIELHWVVYGNLTSHHFLASQNHLTKSHYHVSSI